jgi:hypothetical protein
MRAKLSFARVGFASQRSWRCLATICVADATVEKPFVARMHGILVALRDHCRGCAFEDVLQNMIVLTRESSRLWDTGFDPTSVGGLDPVGTRSGYDCNLRTLGDLRFRSQTARPYDAYSRHQAPCSEDSKISPLDQSLVMTL